MRRKPRGGRWPPRVAFSRRVDLQACSVADSNLPSAPSMARTSCSRAPPPGHPVGRPLPASGVARAGRSRRSFYLRSFSVFVLDKRKESTGFAVLYAEKQ